MTDDEFAVLQEMIVLMQGSLLATRKIQREICRDLALMRPDPAAYAKGMHERVSVAMDESPLSNVPKLALGVEREVVDAFLSRLLRELEGEPKG